MIVALTASIGCDKGRPREKPTEGIRPDKPEYENKTNKNDIKDVKIIWPDKSSPKWKEESGYQEKQLRIEEAVNFTGIQPDRPVNEMEVIELPEDVLMRKYYDTEKKNEKITNREQNL